MRAAGQRTAAVLVALTILACVVALAGSEPIGEDGAPAPPPPSAQQEPPPAQEEAEPQPVPMVPEVDEPEEEPTEAESPSWLRWLGLALLALVAILLARMLYRSWRGGGRRAPRRARRREEPEEADPEEEATAVARRAVDAALVPLRDPADAREAVIEAYVRMEQVLAGRALARRTPEAPREYLDRVLREQGMPERSLTTLTALFEEARFSRHPIPDSAPEEARAELEHARAALGS